MGGTKPLFGSFFPVSHFLCCFLTSRACVGKTWNGKQTPTDPPNS